MDFKLEVVVLPVSELDRAKDFYKALGWRQDADFVSNPDGNQGFVQEVTTRLPGR
jgi:catechol 2,3-dioxygenase-like lactoylglutathione lyase family enzyme